MKLRLWSSLFLFTFTTVACANDAPIKPATDKLYVGAFGGLSVSKHVNASQYGTVFLTEADGGALSVNAFGRLSGRNTSFFGAQLGVQAHERALHSSSWTFSPAAEFEGYTMSTRSLSGNLLNNTQRVPEHNFAASYPMSGTMFLANAVASFNNPHSLIHPYIGLGMGHALVQISGARSIQIDPAEVGLNHYYAKTGDTTSTFAGQVKLGASYDMNPCVSFFAEYRWLYLANTHFVFGSTTYPTHAETSSWQVVLEAQRHHLGNVGLRFNW